MTDHEKDPVHTLHVMMRAWDMAVRAHAAAATVETQRQVEGIGNCVLAMCQHLTLKACRDGAANSNIKPLKPVH